MLHGGITGIDRENQQNKERNQAQAPSFIQYQEHRLSLNFPPRGLEMHPIIVRKVAPCKGPIVIGVIGRKIISKGVLHMEIGRIILVSAWRPAGRGGTRA